MTTILRGVVGSTAYGLAREDSDVDELGVFVAPTLEIAGLDWNTHKESRVTTDPDVTLHEVGKFLRLALKGNPTITELLWLDDYTKATEEGRALASLRFAVQSEKAYRNAYFGYAVQQSKKLESCGDSFSADTRKRTAKHGRHMLRLMRQARDLAQLGHLIIRVDNPEEYWAFDDMTPDQMLAVFRKEMALTEKAFDKPNCLPAEPNTAMVRHQLEWIRKRHVYVLA